MKIRLYWLLGIFILIIIFPCCGFRQAQHITSARITPLKEVNFELIIEQQEGLEIIWEDAKDVRDFYRGGVQHKAKAEAKFRAKEFAQALELFKSSNDFFLVVLNYIDEDSAEQFLFEGHHILFFPNLLAADNFLKIGKILQGMGRNWWAKRNWQRALSYAKQSLKSEQTEWGLTLQQEIIALLKAE